MLDTQTLRKCVACLHDAFLTGIGYAPQRNWRHCALFTPSQYPPARNPARKRPASKIPVSDSLQ